MTLVKAGGSVVEVRDLVAGGRLLASLSLRLPSQNCPTGSSDRPGQLSVFLHIQYPTSVMAILKYDKSIADRRACCLLQKLFTEHYIVFKYA